MDDDLRKQIISILRGTIENIEKNNTEEISRLSNFTMHAASIYQNEEAITIAVLIYSLSKIYEREQYKHQKSWNKFNESTMKNLDDALKAVESGSYEKYKQVLKGFFSLIDKLDMKLKKYIASVFRKAMINKGSRLYEHGISLGRTAELFGITQYEMMEYAGNTFIADTKENQTRSIIERIKIARGLFA